MYTVGMDNEFQNPQPAELPTVQPGGAPQSTVEMTHPSPVNSVPNMGQQGPIQATIALLMSTSVSPHQMSAQFAKIKEDYLAQTYGVTIE